MSTEKNATEKSAAKHSVLTLRVAEAQTKDATRGIARLDPADLARIGATIGDVISIQGDKKTVVKAMPAYVADLFGTRHVGAIYGSLLTAWSAAALLGPLIITQLAARAKAALPPGASRVHIYDQPLAVLAALLACGLLLTLAVRPLRPVPPG